VSLQMAIMKVLSGHPDGYATLADLNADLAVLYAVADWTSRMRRLALRKPDLDIFSQGIVVRDENGWKITAEGFRIFKSSNDLRPLTSRRKPPNRYRSRPATKSWSTCFRYRVSAR
jgi:hypothetical protein